MQRTNAVELLAEALAAGLLVTTDGPNLVVRGSPACEPAAVEVLRCKSELMPLLDEARQHLQAMRLDGYQLIAIGPARLRVTPPLPAARRAVVMACKVALISHLRAETPAGLQALYDLDADSPPPDAGDRVWWAAPALRRWERLAVAGRLGDAIEEFVRDFDGTTFAELERRFDPHMDVRGEEELPIGPGSPHVYWAGMSRGLVEKVGDLLRRGRLHLHPATLWMYLHDGDPLDLPIVTEMQAGDRRPGWLPVALRIEPFRS